MKKLSIIIAGLFLMACERTEIPQDCSCGTIANDGIENGCYYLEIRNDCTGNKKKFCFDQDIWQSNFVGDPFCVTNQNEW